MTEPIKFCPCRSCEVGAAILAERERIIKLLEERFDDTALWRQIEWSPDVYEGFNKQELIALIKGEQK